MLIDITLKITPKRVSDAQENEKKSFAGHLGTLFDVMNKNFPLEYTKRAGIVFDVSPLRIEILNLVTLMQIRFHPICL